MLHAPFFSPVLRLVRAITGATALAVSLSAQPVPEGIATAPLRAGGALFSDNPRFVFETPPAALAGLNYARTSFQKGAELRLRGAGFVYVITPTEGHAQSQAAALREQGFVAVPFDYAPTIWIGLPPGFRLQLLEKEITSDTATIRLGRWGVPVFSEKRLSPAPATVVASAAAATPAALVPAPRTEPWWTQRHAAKLAEAGRASAELVLLGDSITQRWETDGTEAYAAITARFRTLNLGYSGDRTQHVLWRIANGELDGLRPARLVLLIGTNNLPAGRSTPDETLAGIDAVVAAVRAKLPDTRILLLSVFPRGSGPADPVMTAVRSVNAGLFAIAARHGCEHRDLGALFTDPATGGVRADLMPDRLHLNAQGYAVWARVLTDDFLAADR
jgi:Lysophospholipase L1 and related esterases